MPELCTTPLQLQPPPSMIFLRCCVAMYTSAPNLGACMLKHKPRRQAAQQSSRFKPLTGHWPVAGTESGGIWAIHAGHSSPGSQSQSYGSTPASDTLVGQGWKGWRFWRQGLPPLRRQTMKWRQSGKITTNRHAKMIRLRYRGFFPMLKTWDWQRYQSVRTLSERLMLFSLVFSMKDRACWSYHCHVVSFRLGYSAVASKGHRLMKVWRMTRQSAACAWPQPLWFLHAIFSQRRQEPSGAVCWGPISLIKTKRFMCLQLSNACVPPVVHKTKPEKNFYFEAAFCDTRMQPQRRACWRPFDLCRNLASFMDNTPNSKPRNSQGFDVCLCQDDFKNFGFSSGFHGSLKFMEIFKVSTSVYASLILKTWDFLVWTSVCARMISQAVVPSSGPACPAGAAGVATSGVHAPRGHKTEGLLAPAPELFSLHFLLFSPS